MISASKTAIKISNGHRYYWKFNRPSMELYPIFSAISRDWHFLPRKFGFLNYLFNICFVDGKGRNTGFFITAIWSQILKIGMIYIKIKGQPPMHPEGFRLPLIVNIVFLTICFVILIIPILQVFLCCHDLKFSIIF